MTRLTSTQLYYKALDAEIACFLHLPSMSGGRRKASVIDPHLARTQYGFRSSRSTRRPVFIARRIQGIAEASGGELLLTFLDWK